MGTEAFSTPQLGIDLFRPHPNLDDEINRNICQSEIEGGVYLEDLPIGAVLELETRSRIYTMENRGHSSVLLSGHPKFCPQPVLVKIYGCTWGKAMIKLHFIGRGMHLEFRHPIFGVVRTSRIQEIREVPRSVPACEQPHDQIC